jgi:FkbM family methyltransferase
MEQQIRNGARKYLPSVIRKPLGRMAGRFNERIVQNIGGLVFDLKGGRFHADGCIFSIPTDVTSRAYRACFLSDKYEREERELVRKWLRPQDTVIELGACLGIVSCVTNKLLADKKRHVVVEGNPLCIASIYKNRDLNGAEFLVEHCAVGNKPEVTFYLHPVYIVGGTVERASNRPCRVPAKSLRQLDQERGPFTTLIIDIEGSEKEVFESSIDLLKRYRLVIAELHEWAIGADGVERCRELLKQSGLRHVGQAGIVEAWERASAD